MTKYKRSEWYRGLLEAEQMYKDGWVLDYHEGMRIQFKHSSGGTCAFWSSGSGIAHQNGCLDYVSHLEHMKCQ